MSEMTPTLQTYSAVPIIRQKEPTNLETPLDQVDSYLTLTKLCSLRSHIPHPLPIEVFVEDPGARLL